MKGKWKAFEFQNGGKKFGKNEGADGRSSLYSALIVVVLKSVCFKNILLSPGNQLSACQKEYQKNLRRQSASRYVPRCAVDGSYGKVQCTGGLCYCVTPRGEQIPGTKTFNSARKPNCSHPGILKPIKQSGNKYIIIYYSTVLMNLIVVSFSPFN